MLVWLLVLSALWPTEAGADAAMTHGEARSSLQTLWTRDKVIVGGTLRVGQDMYFGALETHLMWTTATPTSIDRPFLGSQYGLYFELVPLRSRYFELSTALGADVFHLWGIHGDEVQISLSTKIQGCARLPRGWGVTLGARAYPVSTPGVALGETRAGGSGMPVLLSTGVEWTW